MLHKKQHAISLLGHRFEYVHCVRGILLASTVGKLVTRRFKICCSCEVQFLASSQDQDRFVRTAERASFNHSPLAEVQDF